MRTVAPWRAVLALRTGRRSSGATGTPSTSGSPRPAPASDRPGPVPSGSPRSATEPDSPGPDPGSAPRREPARAPHQAPDQAPDQASAEGRDGHGPGPDPVPGGWLGAALAGWRSGRGSLPSTSAGVEICALTVFLGVRAINLGQLAVSLPDALRHTTAPDLFVAVLAGYLVESVALAVVVMRARAYRDERWGRLDVGTAVLVLLVQPAFVAPQDTTGSWTAWGFACTLGSACGAAIVFRHRRATTLAVLALICGYLIGALPTAPESARSTVMANAVSYAGFAVLTRLLVGYLRRLGASAEEARGAAAEAAAEAARLREVERQRGLLHDNISVLRLLARSDLPAELADPLRSQATALANKVRTFLDDAAASPRRLAPQWSGAEIPPLTDTGHDHTGPGGQGPGGGRKRELTAVVQSAAEGFWDLRLVFNLDLAQGTELAEPTAAAVEAAVATLLHNVRVHAEADDVVLHADVDESAREWEITVRDNGQGFDTATTPLNFGLRVQVTDTLSRHRIRVELRSHPGDGTTVTLRGPLGGTP